VWGKNGLTMRIFFGTNLNSLPASAEVKACEMTVQLQAFEIYTAKEQFSAMCDYLYTCLRLPPHRSGPIGLGDQQNPSYLNYERDLQ
jgi:hypothetical protein